MKKVLLITYHYPPSLESATRRAVGLVKYLPKSGWEPIVVTPKCYGARRSSDVIETHDSDSIADWKRRLGLDPTRGIHQQFSLPVSENAHRRLPHTVLLSWTKEVVTFPDPHRGWVRHALDAISELKSRCRIEAIVTTFPPPAAHMIGRRAKRALDCPWIADFRDVYRYAPPKQIVTGYIVRDADALVTVSTPLAQRLRTSFDRNDVWVVPNGFDPEEMASGKDELTRKFTITYTGSLYSGDEDKRARIANADTFLNAIAALLMSGELSEADLAVRFYGPPEPLLPALVQRHRLSGVVHMHNRVPHSEAVQRQRESQMLLVLGGGPGFYSGKVFEYLAARRPILAVDDPEGVVSRLLEETRTGFCTKSEGALNRYLRNTYEEYRVRGAVSYISNQQAVDGYSHATMAKQFADILERVSHSSRLGAPHLRPAI